MPDKHGRLKSSSTHPKPAPFLVKTSSLDGMAKSSVSFVVVVVVVIIIELECARSRPLDAGPLRKEGHTSTFSLSPPAPPPPPPRVSHAVADWGRTISETFKETPGKREEVVRGELARCETQVRNHFRSISGLVGQERRGLSKDRRPRASASK